MSKYDRSASVTRRKRALTPDLSVCGLEQKLSLSAMIASAAVAPAPPPGPTGADVNELFPWLTPDSATKNPPSSTGPMTNPLNPMSGVPGTNIGVLAPTMTILPASNPPETSPLHPGQIIA